MRETRPSGLEGGAGSNTPFLPLSPTSNFEDDDEDDYDSLKRVFKSRSELRQNRIVCHFPPLPTWSLSLARPNAKETLIPSQEDLSLADGRRGKGLFTQLILRDEPEICAWPNDVHHSFIVQEINQAIGRNEGGVMLAEPFLPEEFARGGFEAMRYPRV